MDEERAPRAAAVFDALGAEYESAFGASPAHHGSLRRLLADLTPGSRVLDVGSGTGRPTAATLTAAGHDVVGVDVSPVMVDLARRRVPQADFRQADIRAMPLADASFDAVCVYFSLLQMSRAEQSSLLHRLARALRPGGTCVVATVPLDVEDVQGVFMGQDVRVTSFAAEDFTAAVREAGLSVTHVESLLFTPAHPDAAPEPHLFLHCRREHPRPTG
ncbi:class I SAM-dependent methyltransferase [Streptomyces sp. NBC_00237]|uniref:class I SAM-dependent methyltransferase n=1 Tax=Streptomyces sp. NBC_00237 TaxID=2975687 RepID=UPI0022582FBA|nr:class I SAM-dependent methyltransferase [Streptomyces sp. NBC_00237]MCX5202728.1 class I SAM-dependent methyltransferase [Streptomyces sp. NBC_00237]